MAASTSVEVSGTATGQRPGLSVKHYVALVVAGVAILQLLWIAIVPPFRGSDEFDHAFRAAGVAAGQYRPTTYAENGRGLLVEAPADLVAAAKAQCEAMNYTGPDNCSPVEDVGNDRVAVASAAGGYNPAFYWVVGKAAAPFDGAAALYAMRAAGALLCLVFIGLAAWCVAQRPGARWTRLGVVVAITPVMLYSTAVAAPNGLEMAAALAFWAALLSLDGSVDHRNERRLIVVAAIAAAVIIVDRNLGPLFALVILLTVWGLQPDLVRHALRRHTRLFIGCSAGILVFAAWAVTWFVLSGAGRPAPEAQGSEWKWSALLLWPLQAIAAFPYRDQPGALIVYPVVLLVFGALVLAALRVGNMRQRVVLCAALALSIAIPLVLTAATFEGRGLMWQGRYGLPVSMGIVLVAAAVLDSRRWTTRLRPGLLVLGSGLMAVATAACFVKLLEVERLRPPSADDPAWHAPSVPVVVVGTVAAWLLLHHSYARADRVRS